MLQLFSLARRRHRGFTLTEVVVTAVLIAIATALIIPQMSGSVASASDQLAQSSDLAAVNAATQFIDTTGSLGGISTTALASYNHDLTFVTAANPSTSSTVVSIGTDKSGTTFVAASLGTSGCWFEFRSTTASSSSSPTTYNFEPLSAANFNCSASLVNQCLSGSSGSSWSSSVNCHSSTTLSATSKVSVGSESACTLVSVSPNTYVYCWGDNSYGELGNGTTTSSSKPVQVLGITNAVSVSVGVAAACAVVSGGTVYCWGDNAIGQVGQPTSTAYVATPTIVSGLSNVIQVGAANPSSCALETSGAVYCWGGNANGELGNGTTTDSYQPVAVSGITTATQIAVGNASCAIVQSGGVYCWGYGGNGQLGNSYQNSTTPIPVATLPGGSPQLIASGSTSTCVMMSGGALYCWGDNTFGQLGTSPSSTASSNVPLMVTGLTTVTQLSVGSNFACVNETGGVACWGYNGSGQLATSTSTSQSYTPLSVSGLSSPSGVSAGTLSACATTTTGATYCWGDNSYGELGNGTSTSSTTPVQVLAS